MSRLLYRLGRSAAANPWRTISAWVVTAVAAFTLAGVVGGAFQDDWNVPGSQAQEGFDLLREHSPGFGTSAGVVVHDPDGDVLDPATLTDLSGRLASMPHATALAPPRISADGDTALLTVPYDVEVTHPDLMGNVEPLEEAVAPTEAAGLQVELTGELPSTAASEMNGQGELIGVAAALVILVLTFGSVVASGLPIGTALAGLALGSAGIGVLAGFTDVSTMAPTVASMVGLGVGIDYALLLVTRHVEYLRAGHDRIEAAGRAVATAGRSVVMAGATVLVSLMGLGLAGLPTYSAFGYTTGIVVVAVMAASLTLVPALLRFAGHRVLPRKIRRPKQDAARAEHEPLTARWAQRVGRRPLPWALAALLLMVTLAAPALSMRTWPHDDSSKPTSTTGRQAYDLVAAEFGDGANSTLTVTAHRDDVAPAEFAAMTERLADHPGIESVGEVHPSADGELLIVDAQPEYGPADELTPALVEGIRTDVLADGALLTGTTALYVDISERLTDRLPLVIGFVVGVSLLLLAMMFRSVVVPVKAALMNLLSIVAAYGVVTAIFQWGWGAGLLGLDHAMPVSSWLPILMFAILFGLSMDYEVFLLSRVREEWLRTGDAQASVVHGLSRTGRVISAAAAIMVAVFLGFATEADVVVKMMGVGMAVAVALDATVIRMVLVPATMSLLGRWNWWLPGWLDRRLPNVAAEVELADLSSTEPVRTPDAGGDDQDRDDRRTPVGV